MQTILDSFCVLPGMQLREWEEPPPPSPVDSIPGWFGFAELYDRAVESAPPDSTLVEVGVFCGKSLIYLAQKAKAANKGLRVYGVDTFRGSPEFNGRVWFDDKPFSTCPKSTLVATAYENIHAAGLEDDVTLIVAPSVKAADLFMAGDVHMVFLDAGHGYEDVASDLYAWSGKVRRGGILAGDDYWGFATVRAAVDDLVPDVKTDPAKCWWEVQY